jgi:hypothetical protein
MTFRLLDAALIAETARALEARIADRFPQSGLRGVATDLAALSVETRTRTEALAKPLIALRLAIFGVVALGALVFAFVGTVVPLQRLQETALGSVESVEAALNTVILAGFAIFALANLESRIKRRRVLKDLHGLRSLIHVIDMHQLTKDPAATDAEFIVTAHSPVRPYTRIELGRYLDYCSELISLTGKLAALYAQAVNDEGVADAVNDIESLGGNLSRKIWQKISLLEGQGDAPAPIRKRAKPQ